MEEKSIFVEFLGESPYIKVLDFLIEGQEFDYNMTEIARGAGVGWSAFTRIWDFLNKKNIVLPTRTIGNAKMFKLNKKNIFIQKLIKLDSELSKIETQKLLNTNIKA
jgi:hypothetical protein